MCLFIMDSQIYKCYLMVLIQAWYHYNKRSPDWLAINLILLVPDGYIPRLESKERECWKFLDWRLTSENDSRLHGQPSIVALILCLTLANIFVRENLKEKRQAEEESGGSGGK